LGSAENPFSNHQCATSLPVANQTPLWDFIWAMMSDKVFALPGRLEMYGWNWNGQNVGAIFDSS
jgi:hypothetical protein